MRIFLAFLFIFALDALHAQQKQISGTWSNPAGVELSFSENHSFVYRSKFANPIFFRIEPIEDSGSYALKGDTLILNPELDPRPYVETVLTETKSADDSVSLTFNHIKRYFDSDGKLMRMDTVHIGVLDYAINDWKKSARRRVAPVRQVHCTFAGFIPKEIITSNSTIRIARPAAEIKKIYFGCYEAQGTKEFLVMDHSANEFVFNVYSNYYENGQIRQMKLLVKNEKYIYTHQRKNGSFKTDTIWDNTKEKLKREEQ